MLAADKFIPVKNCWTCGGDQLVSVHEARFDLAEYWGQDPELAAYTGHKLGLQRCRNCGFVGDLLVRTLSAADNSSSNLRLVYQKCNSSDWFVPDNQKAP